MLKFGKWLSLNGGDVNADGFPDLPLDYQLTKAFFGALVKPRLEFDPIFGEPRKKVKENGGHVSSSTVTGFKCALVWLHEEKGEELDSNLDEALNRFITGYKKDVADLKQQGEMHAFEGKHALSYAGYKMLAEMFLKLKPTPNSTGNNRTSNGTAATWQMGTFGWAFLIFQWNLLARSITVAGMMLAHIGWRDDHLTCTTPRTKTDQTGESAFPKSIFANPCEPVLCPVLALAVTIFSRPYRAEGVHPALFQGREQEDRYSKLLAATLQRLPDAQLALLGAKRGDIGTHSARKGAPTYALSMPGGPTPASVFLRAGWSLGSVKDRYIFEGDGADQVRARTEP